MPGEGKGGGNDFNPRPPCGGRQEGVGVVDAAFQISIHAPRVGGDVTMTEGFPRRLQFQSTPPVWGATSTLPLCPVSGAYFNPRPPCGGRPTHGRRDAAGIRISIHAPRVGGDVNTPPSMASSIPHFNPRPPCGGRQQKQLKIQAVRAKNRQFLQISSPNSYPILKNKVASLQIILQNLVRDLGDFLRVYVSHLKHQYIFWVVGCLYSKMLDLVFIAVSQVIKTKTVLFRVHDLTQLCL